MNGKKSLFRFGLLGEKLGHSYSPEIHDLLLQKLGYQGSYDLIEIPAALFDTEAEEKFSSYDGLNVTIPYKTKVMSLLDGVSPEAGRIGAVNTILCRNGKYIGYNTDLAGVKRSFQKLKAEVKGKDAVVLGTGGAARAVIQTLFDEGAARIYIVSRDPSRRDPSFASFIKERKGILIDYETLEAQPGGYILINATPVGMYPHEGASPVSEKTVSSFPKVMDLIYHPARTVFLSYAKKDAINGLYMLVSQAAAAEEIWLGQEIPESLIDDIASIEEARHEK